MLEGFFDIRYGGVTQVFHWATALLVLIAFIYGPGRPEDRVYALALDSERRLHETLGLYVIALAVLRVLWRLIAQGPAMPPKARWMHLSSRARGSCAC